MLSIGIVILLPLSMAQFVPRFPYYNPQDFLLEYYTPPAASIALLEPSYPGYTAASSFDSQPARAYSDRQVLHGLPLARSQFKFDPFARQPGVVPKLSGFVRTTTTTTTAPRRSIAVVPLEFEQPGAAPKFTGSFIKNREDVPPPRLTAEEARAFDVDDAEAGAHRKPDAGVSGFSASVGPITNPAAHFLSGTHFEKLSAPKCRMLNCAGPVPNDGSMSTTPTISSKRSACSQVLVPINGCAGGDGYPMAMLCSVCCECTAPLVSELLKSAANFRA